MILNYETILFDSSAIYRTYCPLYDNRVDVWNVRELQLLEDASDGSGVLWGDVGLQRMAEQGA